MEAYVDVVAVEILKAHVRSVLTKRSLPRLWMKLHEQECYKPVEEVIKIASDAIAELLNDVAVQNITEEAFKHCSIHLTARINKVSAQQEIYREANNLLSSSLPSTVFNFMRHIITEALKDYENNYLPENLEEQMEMKSEYSTVLCNLSEFMRLLESCELLQTFIVHPVTSVIEERINEYATEECAQVLDEHVLIKSTERLNCVLLGWLQILFRGIADKCSGEWKLKILNHLYHSFGKTRIDEFFEIIVEFPESLPAVQDLKECLIHADLWSQLKTSLKKQFSRRLLHPGANTADVLTHYISSIKALHILDPTGVILENVCASVQAYLRTRDDTVFCIMASLTDDGGNELSEELASGHTQLLDLSEEYDDENENFLSWVPDPVDANPLKTSKSRQTEDIVSILVNIYGSQEMFVNEYRHLLADRLLQSLSYDTSHELRNLELLKLRFGEANLYFCDVMLKDIADSRRSNAHIHAHINKDSNDRQIMDREFNCFMLSRVFWPNLKRETFETPTEIKGILELYTEHFQRLKGMRTLEWCLNLGAVEVELELHGRQTTFIVTPPKAILIWHFQDKDSRTVDELCGILQSQPSTVRKHLLYWVCQGVLIEESLDKFTLTTSLELVEFEVNDEADEDMITGDQTEQNENDEMLWSYISAMLTNLGAMPIERIQTMLKMFMTDMKDYSVAEIKTFLDKKVKNQELLCSGGCYQLT